MRNDRTLPPGQRRVDGFPRFGAHLWRSAPAVPGNPVIEIRGAVAEDVDLPLAELATLPRLEITADFHCVAGWSATDLTWEGLSFETLYRRVIEPALPSGTSITHVVSRGLDGWESVLTIDDALADDVLIAENLNGSPLTGDHGAPARLVSPHQYGYVSVKHLSRNRGTHRPTEEYRRAPAPKPSKRSGLGRGATRPGSRMGDTARLSDAGRPHQVPQRAG